MIIGLCIAEDVIKPHPASEQIHFVLRHLAPFHMLIGFNILASKLPVGNLQATTRVTLIGLACCALLGLLKEDFKGDENEAITGNEAINRK